jgi:protein subunit release factor A
VYCAHSDYATNELPADTRIMVVNEWDIRIDVYTSGVLREDNPNSYPSVVVTHIPTGIVIRDASTPSQMQNKVAAIAQLEARLAHDAARP